MCHYNTTSLFRVMIEKSIFYLDEKVILFVFIFEKIEAFFNQITELQNCFKTILINLD